MSCNIFIIFSLMVIVGAASLPEASSEKAASHGLPDNGAGVLPETASLDNNIIYTNVIIQSLVQYEDDLNQSSYILDEFVKKNMTSNEAMVATSSLFGLSSHSQEIIHAAKPIGKYAGYHNDTIRALTYLREYLWDMAKFYETNKISYALAARENFNESLYYYGQAKPVLNRTD
jgi:hypothetical protein